MLAAIAFVFFVGVIVSHYLGGVTAGLAVLGVAIMLYLAVAIGRGIGSRK